MNIFRNNYEFVFERELAGGYKAAATIDGEGLQSDAQDYRLPTLGENTLQRNVSRYVKLSKPYYGLLLNSRSKHFAK